METNRNAVVRVETGRNITVKFSVLLSNGTAYQMMYRSISLAFRISSLSRHECVCEMRGRIDVLSHGGNAQPNAWDSQQPAQNLCLID